MATYEELVQQLSERGEKHATIAALRERAQDVKPALLRGLRHPAWRVRHGCLQVLDHTEIDDATRLAIVEALDDPHRKVRRAAMHALSCELCKPEGFCGIEGVDVEARRLDMARGDPCASNRAKATGALRWQSDHSERTGQALRDLVANDESAEVRRRAAEALAWLSVASITDKDEQRAAYLAAVEHFLASS